MRIYDFANENIVLSEKFEKSQIYSFDWSHVGWGDKVSLHENSHSHSRSLRVFEVEVRGFKIFEAFLRLRVM